MFTERGEKTMTKFYLMVLFAVSFAVAACSGMAGESKIDVKVDGKDHSIEIKTSGTMSTVKTFSYTKDGQTTSTKGASNYIALANYELDTSSGMISMGKPLTEAGQVRVTLQLVGEEGSEEMAAPKTGTYTTKAEKFNKVDHLQVTVFNDGKETKTSINIDKAEGEVRITSSNDDTISGEINITEGDKSVKGTFTATVTKRK